MDVIQQVSNLDWAANMSAMRGGAQNLSISVARLRHIDNLEIDRKNGICPLPLYEFSESDWGALTGDEHLDDLRKRLKKLGIYQYFFPAPDQLALGLAERTLGQKRKMIEVIERAPDLGHPFGDLEILKDRSSIPKRSTIKFRPQESVFQRLLNRFSMNVSVSPKDFFPK
jgi:hypothetical protein